jgi:hypothetical protein
MLGKIMLFVEKYKALFLNDQELFQIKWTNPNNTVLKQLNYSIRTSVRAKCLL